jgi:hypothetical protein
MGQGSINARSEYGSRRDIGVLSAGCRARLDPVPLTTEVIFAKPLLMDFLTTQSGNHTKRIALCLNTRCWAGFFGILSDETCIQGTRVGLGAERNQSLFWRTKLGFVWSARLLTSLGRLKLIVRNSIHIRDKLVAGFKLKGFRGELRAFQKP